MRDLYLAAAATPSAAYRFYAPGFHQSASDGIGQINDLSAANSPVFLQSGVSYATALAGAGWVTLPSSRSSVQPNGTGLQRLGALNTWNMASAQGFVLAFEFKTSSAALPSQNAQLVGYSPSSTFAGFHFEIRSSDGKLTGWFTDGANTVNTGGFGSNVCDGNLHTFLCFVDGVGKKAYISIDGGRQYYGISIAAVTGNTSNSSSSLCFGNTGAPSSSGTFDAGATPTLSSLLVRNLHALLFSGQYTPGTLFDYLESPAALYRPIPSTLIT